MPTQEHTGSPQSAAGSPQSADASSWPSTEMLDVAIIGAGISGLAVAVRLHREGFKVRVFEAADGIGGRVRTDEIDGFRLDRGFQVLLTAYPEAQDLLDYETLDLRPFRPGAMIRADGSFHTLADPRRRPGEAAAALRGTVTTLRDGLRVLRLAATLRRTRLDELFTAPQTTTARWLERYGFSDRAVERFFRPFLAGVFLDPELSTASGMLGFVLKMFAEGDAALPSRGMGAIPEQLATRLPQGSIVTGTRVARLAVVPEAGDGSDLVAVIGSRGELCRARAVVVATDEPVPGVRPLPEEPQPDVEPSRNRHPTVVDPSSDQPAPESGLSTGRHPSDAGPAGWHGVSCVYFDAPRPPLSGAWLLLDGEGRRAGRRPAGPVNNTAVLSETVPEYAPAGRSLVSASVLGVPTADDTALVAAVLRQLRGWFGDPVDEWRLLKVYRIERALPVFGPDRAAALGSKRRSTRVRWSGRGAAGGSGESPDARADASPTAPGVFVCGDRSDTPSLNGALASARRAAGEATAFLRGGTTAGRGR